MTLAKAKRRSIAPKERRVLANAWGAQCAYCESRTGPFDIDHIVPHSRGGSCDIENLCLSCDRCNQRKKASPLPQFYEGLLLSIAARKAARIRKSLRSLGRIIPWKPQSAQEAVFGREYVRKYMIARARGNTAPVTATQLLNYEKSVKRAADKLALKNRCLKSEAKAKAETIIHFEARVRHMAEVAALAAETLATQATDPEYTTSAMRHPWKDILGDLVGVLSLAGTGYFLFVIAGVL